MWYLAMVWFLLAGCALGKSVMARFDVSSSGEPAVMADAFSRNELHATPGGFTSLGIELERNSKELLGVISNESDGEEKDVFIYVRRQGKWLPYLGIAEVKTQGYIEVGGKKTKLASPFYRVEALEAIHFGTPSLQGVTLRTRRDSGGVLEIVFDTGGGRLVGNHYYRVNDLFIKLPEGEYKLVIYSYAGYGFFRHVTRVPYKQYVNVRNESGKYYQVNNNMLVSWWVRL